MNRFDSKASRIAAFAVILAAAGWSLWRVLLAGRHNNSILLVALFVTWVLSPYLGLVALLQFSRRWSFPLRAGLHGVIFFIVIISWIAYSGAWSPPDAKPAFSFLATPLVAWFMIGVVMVTSRLLSPRK